MTLLDWLTALSELGAVGVLGLVVYLFVKGRIMSEQSVKKIMAAQANHMADLKGEVENLRKHWGKKLDSMVDLLKDIRDNGAMNHRS